MEGRFDVARVRGLFPALADGFVHTDGIAGALMPESVAQAVGHATPRLEPEVLDVFESHAWPGNVRELRNVVERAVALSAGETIGLDDLPVGLRGATPVGRAASLPEPSAATLARSKEEAEKLCIAEALQRHSNNRLRAAAELGISRMTLYNKLHKYGLMGLA